MHDVTTLPFEAVLSHRVKKKSDLLIAINRSIISRLLKDFQTASAKPTFYIN